MSVQPKLLDPTKRGPQVRDFEAALRSKLVGQSEAIEALVAVWDSDARSLVFQNQGPAPPSPPSSPPVTTFAPAIAARAHGAAAGAGVP